MAQIEGSDSNGRSTHAELNLVPFIDLMSVLITFLLMTAVWSQVSMIQLGSSIEGKKTDAEQPVDPTPQSDIVLRVDARESGFRLVMEKQTMFFAKVDGQYDSEQLMAELKKFKEQHPNKVDAKLSVEEQLPYEVLITGMDALLQSGFPQITIPTGGID